MFFPPVAWLEHLAPVEDRLLRAIFIQHSVLHRKNHFKRILNHSLRIFLLSRPRQKCLRTDVKHYNLRIPTCSQYSYFNNVIRFMCRCTHCYYSDTVQVSPTGYT